MAGQGTDEADMALPFESDLLPPCVSQDQTQAIRLEAPSSLLSLLCVGKEALQATDL